MKIIENAEVPKFKPVHIVLESQGEVDFIANLIGNSGPSAKDVFGVDVYTMHSILVKYSKVVRYTKQYIEFKEAK